jgi:hypothetical protein
MVSSHFSIFMKTKSNNSGSTAAADCVWFDVVRERVNGLRFGVVQIVVHDGRVTQVESTERVRLPFEQSSAPVAPMSSSAQAHA